MREQNFLIEKRVSLLLTKILKIAQAFADKESLVQRIKALESLALSQDNSSSIESSLQSSHAEQQSPV